MLVINRIKFAVIDHVSNIVNFHHGHARVFQDQLEPFDKAVQVWHVGQNVIGEEDISNFPLST